MVQNTDALLAKYILGALREEGVQKQFEGSGALEFSEWTFAKRHSGISLTESSEMLSINESMLYESVERRLKRVAQHQERAAIQGSSEAMLGLQRMALQDNSDDVRVAAVEALGTLGHMVPTLTLLLALRDSFWDVRAAAVQALGASGKQVPVKHLVVHLRQESDENVREAIIRVLGRQGEAMPVHVIVDILLTDGSWLVREAAVWALGELGERAPLPPLIYALGFDVDEQVKIAAATSLGRTKKQSAVAPLFAALEGDSSDIYEAASLALQQIDREREVQIPFQTSEDVDHFSDLAFLEKWCSPDISLSEVLQKRKEWQIFSRLTECIKDVRGGVKAEFKETVHGPVLLLQCFYEHSKESLRKALPSIRNILGVDSIESALRSRDDVVRAAVAKAFGIREKREWLDLLVVSFSFARADYSPLRVVVCSMSCRNVRAHDVSLLDQLSEQWLDVVDRSEVHDLADLKVWCQSVA